MKCAIAWILFFAPWAICYAAIRLRKNWVINSKDPALYDGQCWKTYNYAINCSLDTWLAWEPHPGIVGILTFAAFILAAAVSGFVAIRFGLIKIPPPKD